MTGGSENRDWQPEKKAIDPEVLEPEQGPGKRRQNFPGQNGGAWRGETWVYGWPGASIDRNGCIAPGITLTILVICWAEYGFLAALGFAFFHILFGIIGSVQASRNLMAGRPFNIWLWRAGNWLLSFFLTAWLAGGLKS